MLDRGVDVRIGECQDVSVKKMIGSYEMCGFFWQMSGVYHILSACC